MVANQYEDEPLPEETKSPPAETRDQRHLREQQELLHDHNARVASHVNVADLTDEQRSARMHGVCKVYARAALELINRQCDEASVVPLAGV